MLKNILQNTPPQVQQRVASTVAKEVAAATGSNDIKLSTRGKPLSLSVGPPKNVKNFQVSHADMDNLQGTKKLSGKQTLGGANN